ncbi:MAG TPA: DinB family protein, partial [Methylomirabilota bacterium]|nr:DinB family protein [Methylomirabilota bacterium]
DAGGALAAFVRRRREVIALLDGLTAEQWQRAGIHQARGRMALGEWVASLAGHDDNHLDQLRRTLARMEET